MVYSAQDCGNSSANALELPQSCAKPLTAWVFHIYNLVTKFLTKESDKDAKSNRPKYKPSIPYVGIGHQGETQAQEDDTVAITAREKHCMF